MLSLLCVIHRESVLAPGEKVTDEILQYIGYAKEKGAA